MQPGGPVTFVVKNSHDKHPELFDPAKLHQSIIAACLSSGAPAGHADTMARNVTNEVVEWLEKRPEVTSNDIRRMAARYLHTYHPDASYLYEHHRSIV